MADNTYGSIGNRTAGYVERKMLEHAEPHIVLGKFGDVKPLPKNKTTKIMFRRPVSFAAVTTPLSEGIPPKKVAFSYADVEATVLEYGSTTPITNIIADSSEDPVLQDMSMMMGENAGESIEAVTYGVLKGGTNVIYGNGEASRAAVVTALSNNDVDGAIRTLKGNKGMPITRRVAASRNVSTEPVSPAYVAFGHTDLELDIRALTDFVPVEKYGNYQPISPMEIGKRHSVRFIISADLDSIPDAGGTAGTLVSTTGTSADIYPILVIAEHAYGHVPLAGQGAIRPIVINPTPSKTDPLGQNGSVSWQRRYACVRLNELWMVRIEVGASGV